MRVSREQLAVALSAAGIVALFVTTVAAPMAAKLDRVESNSRLLQAHCERQGAAARVMLADIQTVQQCRADMREARRRIPSAAQLGALLEQLAAVSAAVHLSDQNITPGASYTRREMGVLPIEMTFQSNFMSLFAFLQRVESLERTVRVARIDTAWVEDTPSMLKTQLLLQVFFDPDGGA